MAAKAQTKTRTRRQTQDKSGEDQSHRQNGQTERLEWIVAAFSSVIVLALIGFILYEAITKTGTEPDIRFEFAKAVPMTEGHAIEFLVHNDGHVTVADVQIEGTAELGGGETETSTVTLNYLPADSDTEIGLGFSREVNPEQVTLRVLGYTYP